MISPLSKKCFNYVLVKYGKASWIRLANILKELSGSYNLSCKIQNNRHVFLQRLWYSGNLYFFYRQYIACAERDTSV